MASIAITTCRILTFLRWDNCHKVNISYGFAEFSGSNSVANLRFLASKSVTCTISSSSSVKLHRSRPRCGLDAIATPSSLSGAVAEKLRKLVLEFESLSEPIDRVKRLLHYAAILDPPDESIRVAENRVRGCATQVWLDVRVDEFDRVRFKADSDSELAKGYCSCLMWMLEGAEPWEVMKVRSDELEAVNVGLHGREMSRVNTWQNVLMSMQMRTKASVSKKKSGTEPPFEPFIDL